MPVGLSSLLLLRSRDNELSRPPAGREEVWVTHSTPILAWA
jgi:hypothetical protein